MTSLRQRFIEDMQIRNLAVNTQKSYIQQVSLFARYFQKSPELLGPEHIRAYQVYLTNEKKLSTGSITIAISALRFLYRVTLKKDWSFADFIPAPKGAQKTAHCPQPGGSGSVSRLRQNQETSRHLDHLLCRRPTHLRSRRTHTSHGR